MLRIVLNFRAVRNMSKKPAIPWAKKLQNDRVRALQQVPDLPDIEDGVGGESKFFSPLQTRSQRVKGNNPPKEFPPEAIKRKAKKREASTSETAWQPQNWRQVLENVRQMRANTPAPVDTMGCHKCSDDSADEKIQRFQKLVALMLSSQTKDETTFGAMQRLKEKSLTPQAIVEMVSTDLENLLRPVSFFKVKAKHLQQVASILIEKYDSDIPNSIDELVALPGVGSKMAHICMATAWNQVTGIGVDVHVHRISNRLRWVPQETKGPEQTRQALEQWLPRDLWREVNYLLVGFGQTVCTPVRPHCGECLNRNVCPSADKTTKKKSEGNEAIGKADSPPPPNKKSRSRPNKNTN